MARIVDEMFEGAGYEESWTEAISGTGTIDEDFATSSVTGAPADWGSQCLRIVSVDGEGTRTVRDLGTNQAITYTRIETIIGAESVADNQTHTIAYGKNQADTSFRWHLILRQASGVLHFRVILLYDGSTHNFDSGAINLNQRYRNEIKWDGTNLLTEWRLDGVSQTAQIITSGTSMGLLRLGANAVDAETATIYYDNIAIDDATWVGAEAASGGRIFDETFEGTGYVETWVEGP